jgi:alpha-1,4-galacturonosyltransferase
MIKVYMKEVWNQRLNHEFLGVTCSMEFILLSLYVLEISFNPSCFLWQDPRMIMFHIVTDALNFPAMKMWFLTNPSLPATIQVEGLENLTWLPSDFSSRFKEKGIQDLRYTSALNHLRFYLPEVFPSLSKVLLLDHDVVIQKDLNGLWDIDMKGKVIGATETCTSDDGYNRLDSLVDFSDPSIFNKFDAKACVFSFGMNMFDLNEWRKQGLTETYHKWFKVVSGRDLAFYLI